MGFDRPRHAQGAAVAPVQQWNRARVVSHRDAGAPAL